ncbi:MAG TPA: hemerythrin domain-containing protein [Rhizomicrobium sp.]|jgi:hemerythrin superfamily protein|nr:hemerythrin domain-containing protein [Rhizomicrobium sp.]
MDVKTRLKQAGKAVAETLTGGDGQADILDTLKQEHDEVKALAAQLVESDSAPERKALLRRIKNALVPHVRAEEKVVYDAIIAVRGGGDKTKVDGNEGYLEHELADRTLAKLGKISQARSPEFSAAAKVLKELLEHHIREEESNVWDDVREHFSDDQRAGMNARFLAAKKKVKIPA